MRKLAEALTARWLVTLVGAVALALLVWFLGPLIAIADYRPLQSDLVRAAIAAAVLIGWGLINILGNARASARNEQMIDGIAGGAASGALQDDSETDQLRVRLEEALRDLRRLRGADRRGRAYLYELPWYILIGPPGSGKTTALVQSGLNFPLVERFGRGPLRGASGTRNCDWFLTDDAVLLDTAGRYTTQDSDEQADKAAWLGFLDLLKQFRPRQPINGALIAISLTDLMALSEAERKAHGRAIRARLAELQERFGVRFPVYVLLTKADLIAGFVETFESLTREEREQVWGMTFPLETSEEEAPAVSHFDAELRGLLARLEERAIERIQQEADLRRRGLVFGFPTQIASLVDTARELLEEVFRASRYESRPLLRGVYFTSGTQEGTPIDRLMNALVQRFGLQPNRLTAHSGTGRSYFLTRLMREVIFAEASIVSANPRVERRQRLVRWGAYAACAGLIVLACTAWTISFAENRAQEQRIRAALETARSETAKLDAAVLPDADPAHTLAALASLRDLPGGYGSVSSAVPISMRFGLYQGDKLASQEIAAYQRGLNLLLLPRLLARLQQQLRANIQKPEFLYQALKIYLMLGGQHPADSAIVKEWMTYDWEAAYPGPSQTATRAALFGHLEALLQAPLAPYPLDGRLIEDARRALRQVSLAGRAYVLLKERALPAKLAEWRIGEHAGPAADRVLVRLSGKLLSDGVPGLFTRTGFYNFVLPSMPNMVRMVEEDSWVLGRDSEKVNAGSAALLEADTLKLYYDDYNRVWDAVIADVSVPPLHGTAQAAEIIALISGPNSSLRLLWRAIAEETKLSHSPAGEPAREAAGAQGAAAPAQSRIGALLSPAAAAARPGYGQPVEAHFKEFQQFVGGTAGGPAPMDELLSDLGSLYQKLNATPGLGGGASGGTVSELVAAARKLEAGAARMPAPVAKLAQKIARQAPGASFGGIKAQIDAAWKEKVLKLCVSALDGRYPLQRTAQADVTPDDFARLFAPNGLIDGFFNSELRPFVDTSRMQWRPQSADFPIAMEALQQFQLAAKIRDSFFGVATTPMVRFEITPLSIDSDSKKVVLTIDGQEIAYEGGSARPIVVQWPGPGNTRQSEITVEGMDGRKSTLQQSGAWSWFRLLDLGRLEGLGGPDRWRATFIVGPHRVVYELRAGSVVNPLAARDIERFRCPRNL